MTDPSLAAALVKLLDYTTDDLNEVCEREGNERFENVPNDIEVLREIDRLEFQCVFCGWWKPQRENATPDGAQWACKECVASGDYIP